MIRTWMSAAVVALLFASWSPLYAANEGQDSLNAASEKTLEADSLADLSEVIVLCEKAIKEGLDEENTKFAKSLQCGTLLRRGMILSSVILDRKVPNPSWPQIRAQALQDLQRAVELDDTQGEAHYLIGRLNTLPGGDRERARKAAAKAVDLTKDDRHAQSKALVLRANLSSDDKQRQADYDEAVRLADDDPEAFRSRGLFLLLQNKPDAAMADLDAAIKLDPDEASAYEARGLALLMLKKYDEAKKSLDKVVELLPQSPLVYMHRGRVLVEQKKYKEAIDDFTKSLKLDPDNLSALLLRARTHQLSGDPKAAREDVEKALKNRPGMAAALELRGILAATSGDLDQALSDFEELAKVSPKSPELQLQIGILHASDKRPNAAIERFTAALELEKENFPALRSRADSYLAVGKHAEAVADYNAALKLKPKDTGVLNNLAWVLATSPKDEVRDGKRAIELAKEACELTDYKQGHILSTLAAAYAEAGNWDEAVKWSKKGVEIADEANRKQMESELASYESKKPWRELQEEKDVPRKKSAESKDSVDIAKSATKADPDEDNAEKSSNGKEDTDKDDTKNGSGADKPVTDGEPQPEPPKAD